MFSRVPMGNCLFWYPRQLFIALALWKCKKNVNILSIILVQDSRPRLKLLPISYRISSYLCPYSTTSHK